MSELKLGQLIKGDAERDAIHIAVAPVIAGKNLRPGQRIGFIDRENNIVGSDCERIGIVDPFLRQMVCKGQRFWMYLFPGTITSLRHDWTHPAFTAAATSDDDKAGSEKWLRGYAVRMNPYIDDPEQAYNHLVDGLRSGELFARGTDLHGLYELDEADDLRFHAERVLGIRIDWERYQFTCSC